MFKRNPILEYIGASEETLNFLNFNHKIKEKQRQIEIEVEKQRQIAQTAKKMAGIEILAPIEINMGAQNPISQKDALIAQINKGLIGTLNRRGAIKDIKPQEYDSAVLEEVDIHGDKIFNVLRRFGFNATKKSDVPDMLILAYRKHGTAFTQELDKETPIGGTEGTQLVSIATASKPVEDRLNILGGGGAGFDFSKLSWGTILAGISTGFANPNQPTNPVVEKKPETKPDEPKEFIKGVPNSIFFGGIVVALLGLVLYFRK